MWRNLLGWLLRRPVRSTPGAEGHGYVTGVRPILTAFIVLSAVEIPIFDLIVSHLVPWRPARFIVLALGVYGLLWTLGLLAIYLRQPHTIDGGGIRVRHGVSVDLAIGWERIATLRRRYRPLPSSRAVQYEQERGGPIVNVAVGGQTNVEIRLREPTSLALPAGLSEPAIGVCLYADDPDAFVASAHRCLANLEEPDLPLSAGQ